MVCVMSMTSVHGVEKLMLRDSIQSENDRASLQPVAIAMSQAPAQATASQERHGRFNILIVDDTPVNLRLLSSMLTLHGYDVRSAISGSAALMTVQNALPDLILLDITMPKMDGYEVCERLKADERTQEIPVIFLSALSDTADKVKAFNVGGADYITKPFQLEEVLARVTQHLHVRQLQRQITEQTIRLQQEIRDRDRLLQDHEQTQWKLQQVHEELAYSNWKVEQFADIVSQDLQQAIHCVTGFVKQMTVTYPDLLDQDMEHNLHQIENLGQRLWRSTQDLLTYARVKTEGHEALRADCNVILEKVLVNLQLTIAEKKAVVSHAPLPIVIGHEMQLIQLFQNLISNAIMFVDPDILPQVDISVKQQGNAWQFCIRDNGIGISPQRLNHIFDLLKQMKQIKNQCLGSGIGLAACKKIVERHGGTIWVESTLGIGTSVYFILPGLEN
jgi:signal transduction histidine kinase